jgi:hypothetical protein
MAQAAAEGHRTWLLVRDTRTEVRLQICLDDFMERETQCNRVSHYNEELSKENRVVIIGDFTSTDIHFPGCRVMSISIDDSSSSL